MQPRDIQIPLFLWIATAILVHLFWGGGTHQVAVVIEERAALRSFAAGVQREVQAELRPIPIAMLESDVTSPPPPAEPEATDEPDADKNAPKDPTKAEIQKPTPELKEEKKPDEKKPEIKKPDEKKPEDEKKPDDKKPDPLIPEEKKPAEEEKPKETPQQLELEQKRAIAIRQHVKDENQADNPNAKFLADQANKVDEETQAKITSTDQDDPNPKAGAGASEAPPTEQPGNSEQTRVASAFGDADEGSALPSPEVQPPRASPPSNRPETALQSPANDAQRRGGAAPPTPGQSKPGQREQTADPGAKAAPEIIADSEGDYSLGGSAVPRPKKKRLPPVKATKPNDWFGLGSGAVTSSGINLNLSHADAVAVVGEKQLSEDRRMDRLRRRSQRAGTWKKVGLERWRSAIENYVPMVKPGNTTALNAAKAPFASYLNDIHQKIHPIFADDYLTSLRRLPNSDPQNRPELVAHAEIVLSKEDGSLVKAGIVRHSGVTAFDVSALEAILQASPFGKPPEAILSPDGRVYLHWEFYRNPDFACSTYFAHPFILKSAPAPTTPPSVPDERTPAPGPRMPPNLLVPTQYTPVSRPGPETTTRSL
ncbi:MAG: TonB C-terminal domain-containing protein [Polyangiaceae bacterium]